MLLSTYGPWIRGASLGALSLGVVACATAQTLDAAGSGMDGSSALGEGGAFSSPGGGGGSGGEIGTAGGGAAAGGASGGASGSSSGTSGFTSTGGNSGGGAGGSASSGGSPGAGGAVGLGGARSSGGVSGAGGNSATGGASGGPVAFYTENFDAGLGTFTVSTVCGSGGNVPAWSNNGGYAHASEPGGAGVSEISSPAETVPSGVTQVTLQISHKWTTEDGFDGAQLFVSIDGGAATQVLTFTAGGYTDGLHTTPTDCSVTGTAKGKYPGWSGKQSELESDVDLTAAPFNVVPGSTISVILRMSSDNSQSGTGWDVNWVKLVAN